MSGLMALIKHIGTLLALWSFLMDPPEGFSFFKQRDGETAK
jgi:hypothetical protein